MEKENQIDEKEIFKKLLDEASKGALYLSITINH